MYNSNYIHIYKRERTSDSARSATATQCVEQLYRSPASPRFPADIPRRRPRMKLVTAHHRRAKYSANGNSAHKNSTTLKEQQRQGPSCVDFELASNHARSHLAGCAAKTMARTHDMQEFQDPATNEVFGLLHDQRLTRSFDKGETLQSTTCGSMDSCAKMQEVMPSLNCDSDETPHSVANQASKSDSATQRSTPRTGTPQRNSTRPPRTYSAEKKIYACRSLEAQRPTHPRSTPARKMRATYRSWTPHNRTWRTRMALPRPYRMRNIFLQHRLYIFLPSRMLTGEDLKQPGISATATTTAFAGTNERSVLAPSPPGPPHP